ncbi:hypothetical protein, partial [Moorena sp. SIO3I6]|uniref:hypothetical protein n=1 Tax=Moorena sp. SIO3I6 TaxID=2607831 RepID=UPI0025F5DBE0
SFSSRYRCSKASQLRWGFRVNLLGIKLTMLCLNSKYTPGFDITYSLFPVPCSLFPVPYSLPLYV